MEIAAAVFHSLRTRMSVAQSLLMLSELPTFLKPIFIDGWALPRKAGATGNFQDFLDEIREENRLATRRLSTRLGRADVLKGFIDEAKHRYYLNSGKHIENDLVALRAAQAIINAVVRQADPQVIFVLKAGLPRGLGVLFAGSPAQTADF